MELRFAAQKIIKRLGRAAGLEIRYAFQNPAITSAGIYAPWLTPSNVSCIFDVGANGGASAVAYVKEFGQSIVHSFEPFPVTYAQLEKVAQSSNGRIRTYQIACGSFVGQMDVLDPKSSSAMNQLRPVKNDEPKLCIQVTTIDAFCAHHGVDRIDILKTDTEGFDAEVLAGAQRMLSERRVRCVMCEVGFLGDRQHTDFTKVFLLLQQSGLQIAGIYEPSYLREGRTDFANALFILK
jgi:FkbM family methyltransferase